MNKSIKDWQKEVHELAVQKGWWENPRSQTELLALSICELTEGIEEIRKGNDSYYEVDGKPMGLQTEIADCIIRLMDMAEANGWNIEEIMRKKHDYNKLRQWKHGGKKL